MDNATTIITESIIEKVVEDFTAEIAAEAYSKEAMSEPLGVTSEEQKKLATKKLFLRYHGDGGWLPEFKLGEKDYFTERDMTLIIRAIKAGFRRHKRMANLTRRLEAAKVLESVKE